MTQRLAGLFADEPSAGQGQPERRLLNIREAEELLARAMQFVPKLAPTGPIAGVALALEALTWAYEHMRANINKCEPTLVGLYSTQVESKDSTCLKKEELLSNSSFTQIWANSPFSSSSEAEGGLLSLERRKGGGPYPARGAGATEGIAGLFADDGPPTPDVAAAFQQGPSYSPAPRYPSRFHLTPPPAPKGTRVPDGRSSKGLPIPGERIIEVYALCYGADNAEKWRALSKEQVHRVVNALRAIADSGGDLSRLGEFRTWYKSWANRTPSPEKVREFWWRAMSEIDAQFTPVRQGPPTENAGQYAAAVNKMRRQALDSLGVGGPQEGGKYVA